MLLRNESRKRAKLSNLQLLYLENEDSLFTSTSCLFYVISNDKINQNNKIEYNDVLRHRDIRLYILSAMINYFV